MVVSGEYDFEDFKTYIKIIHAKCETEGIFKILMDILAVKGIDVSTLERYFLGVEVAERLSNRIKLAVVWHQEYTNYITQIVAVNRGGNISVFANTDAALNWLSNDAKEE
jgi:D-ribose pyranose/furanose isomerase RbsD